MDLNAHLKVAISHAMRARRDSQGDKPTPINVLYAQLATTFSEPGSSSTSTHFQDVLQQTRKAASSVGEMGACDQDHLNSAITAKSKKHLLDLQPDISKALLSVFKALQDSVQESHTLLLKDWNHFDQVSKMHHYRSLKIDQQTSLAAVRMLVS